MVQDLVRYYVKDSQIYKYAIVPFCRHLKEIQELQSRQKLEIELLYTRLGKVPPAVIIPPAAPLSGRRRRPTKGKSSRSSRSSSQGNKSPQILGKICKKKVGKVVVFGAVDSALSQRSFHFCIGGLVYVHLICYSFNFVSAKPLYLCMLVRTHTHQTY